MNNGFVSFALKKIIFPTLAPVHTTPGEFDNGASFSVHNNPSRKRSRRNLKTLAFRLRVDGKHFENGAFRERWSHDYHLISLSEFSSTTNAKWTMIVAFSNFSSVVWRENIWCVFRVKPPFSNFFGIMWTVSKTIFCRMYTPKRHRQQPRVYCLT